VQRPKDGSDVTGSGSFDNSTCKRVVDLLETGDLRLRQVVIKRVAVVELGVNNGSGCLFGIDVWTDRAKLADEYGNSRIWRQMRFGRKRSGVHRI